MEYFTTAGAASRRAVDCVIVGVYERGKLGAGAADIDSASDGSIKRHLKNGDVSGRLGRCSVLTDVKGVRASRVAVVGLGKVGSFGLGNYRRALAKALQTISRSKCRQILNCLTLESTSGAGSYYRARHTAQTVGEVLYRFTEMKSGRKPPAMPLKKVGMAVASRGDAAKSMRGARHGDAIVSGMSRQSAAECLHTKLHCTCRAETLA
jgi:leucyl aminopeptidase